MAIPGAGVARTPPPPTPVEGSEEVQGTVWRPLYENDQPFAPQEIGRYMRPPLTENPSAPYTQLQRRSGWPRGNMRLGQASASGLIDWQQTQQPAKYPGTQREGGTFAGRQWSRFELQRQRNAITQQAIQQSGQQIIPFLAAINQGNS